MSRPIKQIVIHCSASPNGDSLFRASPGGAGKVPPVRVIDQWHYGRGFRRDPAWRKAQNPELGSIGYHFIVYTNGTVATGRHVDEIGAHVAGNNKTSLGVCLIGTDHFTAEQWASLPKLIAGLLVTYPDASVVGHRDLSPDKNNDGIVQPWEWLKTCPGFDVSAWIKGGMLPLKDHLLEVPA